LEKQLPFTTYKVIRVHDYFKFIKEIINLEKKSGSVNDDYVKV